MEGLQILLFTHDVSLLKNWDASLSNPAAARISCSISLPLVTHTACPDAWPTLGGKCCLTLLRATSGARQLATD